MKNKKIAKLTLAFTLVLFVFPTYAYAYIDPGTGTYILQMLAAIILGSLIAFKQFWSKITGFFKKD